jgi:drug/metabolite transporter (DMT)-like permease
MALTSALFGLATAFCWGTADYLSRSQSERVGHYNTTVYMHVFTILTLLILIPFLNPPLVITYQSFLILALSGVLNFFAFLFLYRAFHKGIVSIVAPLAYTYPAVTTVLALFLLGSHLSTFQTLALISIVSGVMLLSTRLSELKSSNLDRSRLLPGAGSAIAAAVSFGTVYVGVGYVTQYTGYFVPVIFLRFVGALLGFGLAPLFKQKVKPSKNSITLTVAVMGVLESLGLLFLTIGIAGSGSQLAIVTALSSLGGAFATSYALFFLKERLEANQIFGVFLALSGVFFLLYLSR